MSSIAQFLGIVEREKLQQIMPRARTGARRFTSIAPQEARSPESGELSLGQYEHQAIMIEGVKQGVWLYSAQVTDSAGPILTAVVRKVFQGNKK
ncbi:MAG: hypothetical protein JSS26_04745 [Nitrospira sp.]|nr:hypothetical protein [Nitrospira sp.]